MIEPQLVLIVGPTASGKSRLAEELASATGGEIVSADALQVYRGLDIGTAKPDVKARARIPHHCIDLFEPCDRCTAGRYARRARVAILDVLARERPCFLVGGSGFYVRATLEGLDAMPTTDPRWRSALEAAAGRRGGAWLHEALDRLDSRWAEGVDPNDRQRLLRALEVVLRTGRRLADQPLTPPFDVQPSHEWLLQRPRPQLYSRIDARVDRMLEAGWLDEVRGLREAGVPADAHGMQAIGYRELGQVLDGSLELGAARDRIRRATRRYAKRQLTWFRRRESLQGVTAGAGSPDHDAGALLERLRGPAPRTGGPGGC